MLILNCELATGKIRFPKSPGVLRGDELIVGITRVIPRDYLDGAWRSRGEAEPQHTCVAKFLSSE